MPVCNTTELSGDYMISVQEFWSWQAEGWDDFRYPSMSIQFDSKTANMTMDAVFAAEPYQLSNVSDGERPITGDPGAHGFIQIRVSGAIDAYHSDSLSLEDERPVWLRTVGFGNDSSNIGYDSGAIMLSSGSTLGMIAIAISIAIVL